ncbi:2628_t:CDS:2, partial [Paraglomus occultum]
ARAFHATPTLFKLRPIIKKKKHQAAKAARREKEAALLPNVVTGISTPFTQSLLRPEIVYQSASNVEPSKPTLPWMNAHFLDQEAEKLLFETTPEAVAHSRIDPTIGVDQQKEREEEKVKLLKNVIGLHNASAKGIMLCNKQLAIKEFSRIEGDTGSPEVQAALCTVRILNLYEHIQTHRKDKHNYRQLRIMVHKRQKILKYLKKLDLERYFNCLKRLGLDQRIIEREIVM